MKTRENLTDRERQLIEVCCHEASHATIGVILGGRLQYATCGVLEGDEPIRGKTVFSALPAGAEPSVFFAGPYGQARWRADGRPSQRDVSDCMGSGCDSDQSVLLAAGGSHLGAGVTALVDRCWGVITSVAGKLASQHTVRQDLIEKMLGLSADPPTAALQLALIRSGSRPGSFKVTAPVAV